MKTLENKRVPRPAPGDGREPRSGRFVKLRRLAGKAEDFRLRNFGGTQKAVYLLTMLLIAAACGLGYMDSGLPPVLSFIAAAVCGLIAANIALFAAVLLLKFLLRNGPVYIICLAAVSAGLAGLIHIGCGGKTGAAAAVAGLAAAWVLFTFARSLWALLVNGVKTAAVIGSAIAAGVLSAALCLALFTDPPAGTSVEDYLLALEAEGFGDGERAEGFEREMQNGPYTAEALYYGAAKAPNSAAVLASDRVNLGPYVGGYKGIQKLYRKLYQGYDIYSVPLTGKVWYPLEKRSCPVLFIVHGNHNLTTASYEGYDYLGEYLASHGYVAVSVDSNACNGCVFGGLANENDGRAVLLLNNIEQVLRYDGEAGNPLFGRIDETKIAVAGHSRGGEAAAAAVLFSRLERYPGDGTLRFFWDDIKIKSVVAIAPTVNQYKPSDHEVELTDVNYLLIQGVNDSDVSSYMGARQYENVSFTGGAPYADYLKSSLYVAGANHGQFNTEWGRYDLFAPLSLFLNTADLLPARDQQTILRVFVKVFLDATLMGHTKYAGLLRDCYDYADYLPPTVYAQAYEESGFVSLCDFEEDCDLTSENGGEVRLEVKGAKNWTEEMSSYSNPSSEGGEEGGYVLNIDWYSGQRPKLILNCEAMDCDGRSLRFDIADTGGKGLEDGAVETLEAEITLTDAKGKKATLPLEEHSPVLPPLPVYQGGPQRLLGKPAYKALYRTVDIPVSFFKDAAGTLDTERIAGIEITFLKPGGGSVELDNIGFG